MFNLTPPEGHGKALPLSSALLARGFRPGAPAHVTGKSRLIDRQLCQEMCCGGCGAFGLLCCPHHKAGVYIVIARCPLCSAEEEF